MAFIMCHAHERDSHSPASAVRASGKQNQSRIQTKNEKKKKKKKTRRSSVCNETVFSIRASAKFSQLRQRRDRVDPPLLRVLPFRSLPSLSLLLLPLMTHAETETETTSLAVFNCQTFAFNLLQEKRLINLNVPGTGSIMEMGKYNKRFRQATIVSCFEKINLEIEWTHN